MAETKFEIKETIGVLSESAKGWTKELSLVSWTDNAPKYPIPNLPTQLIPRSGNGVPLLCKEKLLQLRDVLGGLNSQIAVKNHGQSSNKLTTFPYTY
jgi:hypothetical protein